ncbi:MAG: hypothetical protein COA78_21995 [Blastopirellula sp.]|nr:MAG: hypothetical protein COA78_21995 [Blastopirellula sp.]
MKSGSIAFSDNFRDTYRGLRQFPNGRLEINITDNETQNYDIDLSGIMDTGETISSATFTEDGASVTDTIVINAQDINLKLSNATATGNAYLLFTLSNGNIKQVNLYINVPNVTSTFRDYR